MSPFPWEITTLEKAPKHHGSLNKKRPKFNKKVLLLHLSLWQLLLLGKTRGNYKGGWTGPLSGVADSWIPRLSLEGYFFLFCFVLLLTVSYWSETRSYGYIWGNFEIQTCAEVWKSVEKQEWYSNTHFDWSNIWVASCPSTPRDINQELGAQFTLHDWPLGTNGSLTQGFE